MSWLFLTSGLFLGWSLGANDAANLFGTAVATRMLKFRTAAIVGSAFVVLGALAGAQGTSKTLGRLGAIDAPAGAFTVALAAALAVVLLLTRTGLPVSITQAIVGAILGWNLFTGRSTDLKTLSQLLSSWLLSPLLAGTFAAGLFFLTRAWLQRRRVHLLEVDAWTRAALLVAAAFGAFGLGLNDIANVMGVFVRVSPFPETTRLGPFSATNVEALFLLGGIAIATGICTYSNRVMVRLGSGLASLSPLGGARPLPLRLAGAAAPPPGLAPPGVAARPRLGDAGRRRGDPRDLARAADRNPAEAARGDRGRLGRRAGRGAHDRPRRPLRRPERLRAARERDAAPRGGGEGGRRVPVLSPARAVAP